MESRPAAQTAPRLNNPKLPQCAYRGRDGASNSAWSSEPWVWLPTWALKMLLHPSSCWQAEIYIIIYNKWTAFISRLYQKCFTTNASHSLTLSLSHSLTLSLSHSLTLSLSHSLTLSLSHSLTQLVGGSWGFGDLPRDTPTHPERGIELATLRLPDTHSYLLSPSSITLNTQLGTTASGENMICANNSGEECPWKRQKVWI